MKNMRYSISAQGENIIESKTWTGSIKAVIKLANEFKNSVITIKDSRGIENASFIYDTNFKIIPAYGYEQYI